MSELKGRAVLKIKALAGEFPYSKESKLAGENYRRFAFDSKVFIANTKDKFCTDFDNGNVYSVDLTTNEQDQLSLAGHTTIAQEVNMAKTERILVAVASYDPKEINWNELAGV